MKKVLKSTIFYVVFIGIIVFAVIMILQSSSAKSKELKYYSDVVKIIDDPTAFIGDEKQYELSKVVVGNDNHLSITLHDKSVISEKDGNVTYVYKLRSADVFYNDFNEHMLELVREDGSTFVIEYEPASQSAAWLAYLPSIIIFGVFIIIYIISMRKMMSGGENGRINNFGKARTKTPLPGKERTLFADVAGADEEKEELREVVDFLRDPAKYTRLGAKIPRGVLLVGPPGTGKTLLAKAVAGEAGVPFFSISGSDFVEMYVGVGASRVRDLFETARKAPASIIFIDEIDAVGRHRGAGLGGGHDEREQTLNQLLVEMDGFGTHDGVIVMAATNRPDILDPALLRPGRFDRQITVNVPDIKGREEILKVHARNKPLEPGVDLHEVAKTTSGFTGADLSNLLNEAALLAARRKKNLIGMEDIADAFIKVVAGPQKKSWKIKENEKRKTAYHEAGHAMIAYLLGLDPVQQISIIPSGNALGYTLNPPADDKFSVYKSELKKEISMLLAGRAAEAIIFGDVSGGASNDIQRATKIAKKMVMQLGMSDQLGQRCFGTGQEEIFLGREISSSPDYSEQTAAIIDAEVHKLISDGYELALKLLNENIEKLHFTADCLVRYEMLDGDQFKAIMENGELTVEDIGAIAEEKKQRSIEANKQKAEEAKKLAESQNDDKYYAMPGVPKISTDEELDELDYSDLDDDQPTDNQKGGNNDNNDENKE